MIYFCVLMACAIITGSAHAAENSFDVPVAKKVQCLVADQSPSGGAAAAAAPLVAQQPVVSFAQFAQTWAQRELARLMIMSETEVALERRGAKRSCSPVSGSDSYCSQDDLVGRRPEDYIDDLVARMERCTAATSKFVEKDNHECAVCETQDEARGSKKS